MGDKVARDRLSAPALAAVLLGAPQGGIVCVDGVGLSQLCSLFNEMELPSGAPRLLFLPLAPADTPEAVAENLLTRLADIALRMWPVWYDDVRFPAQGADTLARMAVTAAARRTAAGHPGVLSAWIEAGALLALESRPPKVRRTPAGTQLDQLSRVIGPDGLLLVVEVPQPLPAARAEAFVAGLEWIARHLQGAVVALFLQPPAELSPFDRIRHGAWRLADEADIAPPENHVNGHEVRAESEGPWLIPWRGRPHPLSALEQRLARLIEADAELAPLFGFNLPVETVRGSRPRVDLLWAEGRLVVELDGYADHGTRAAFQRDRHRDFELALSGYAVLRLANDEIAQDCWLALEKIRDLVRHRRQVLLGER